MVSLEAVKMSAATTDCQQWILYKYLKVVARHTKVNDAMLGLKQLNYLTDDEFVTLQRGSESLRIVNVLATILKKGSPKDMFHAFLNSLRDDEDKLEMGHSYLYDFLMDKYRRLQKLRQHDGGDPTIATQKEYKLVEKETGSRPTTPPKSPSKEAEKTFESIKNEFIEWLRDTFRKEMDHNSFLNTLKREVHATVQECFRTVTSSLGLTGKSAKDSTEERVSDASGPPQRKLHGSVSSDEATLEIQETRVRKVCQTRDHIKMTYGYDSGMQQLAKVSDASDSQQTGAASEDILNDPTKTGTRSYCIQSFSVSSAKTLGDVLGRDLVLNVSHYQVGHVLWEDEASYVNVGHFGEHQVAVAIKTRRSGLAELSVKEAFILSKLQSPNIVPLIGVFWIEELATVKLVTECPSTLESYLSLNVTTTATRQFERITLHLCQGLAKLKEFGHRMTIVHNDISSRSCFIRGDVSGDRVTAALGGFTFAEIAKEDGTCTALQVQPAYKQDYDRVQHASHESDVRALAIVVLSLYSGPSSPAVMNRCPPRPPNMPEGLHAVLQECYHPSPSSRPSALDLLSRLHSLHEWRAQQID